jgi:hypothetical protein
MLKDVAFSMSPKDPTILTIDVEGFDLEVLKSNDWNRVMPRVICVEELGNLSPSKDNPSEIELYLESYGYKLKAKTIYLLYSYIKVGYSYLDLGAAFGLVDRCM